MENYVCITGATGELGKSFAIECASRGWNLFLTDLSSEKLSILSKSISNYYKNKIIYKSCDLTVNEQRDKLFQYMKSININFWMLINIAGLDYEGVFSDRTEDQICNMLRLNIESNLVMTNAVLKLRDNNKTFRVINVSSLAAFYPMPVKAMYSSSKRFLLNFSLALREELKSCNGTVTALCPAGMPTTKLCIKCIDAQGVMGILTTTNVGYVASHTIDNALKGHSIYIPGLFNRIINFLGCLPPATFVAHLIGLRWNTAHNKSHKLNSLNI